MSAISGFMGVAVEAENSKQNQKKRLVLSESGGRQSETVSWLI